MPLLPFTKEERILFGLDIIRVERAKKAIMTKAELSRFNKKLERLKQKRLEFLKTYKLK